jgi:hypothetical protein
MKQVGRIRNLLTIILDHQDVSFKEVAQEDVTEAVREFSQLVDMSAALLPTELWVEFRRLNRLAVDILVAYDEGQHEGSEQSKRDFVEHAAKAALLARTFLGIDELATESASLFKTRKAAEKLSVMSPSAIARRNRDEAIDERTMAEKAPNQTPAPDG